MMHRFNIDRKPRIRSLPMAFGSGEPVFLLGKIVCFSILNGKNDEFICVRPINQSILICPFFLFFPTLLGITGRYFIRRIHEKINKKLLTINSQFLPSIIHVVSHICRIRCISRWNLAPRREFLHVQTVVDFGHPRSWIGEKKRTRKRNWLDCDDKKKGGGAIIHTGRFNVADTFTSGGWWWLVIE